jgi:hypothetical protein
MKNWTKRWINYTVHNSTANPFTGWLFIYSRIIKREIPDANITSWQDYQEGACNFACISAGDSREKDTNNVLYMPGTCAPLL